MSDGQGKQDLMDLLGGSAEPQEQPDAGATGEIPASDGERTPVATAKPEGAVAAAAADGKGVKDEGSKGDTAKTDAGAKGEDAVLTDDELKAKAREALGLKPKEPETVDTWKNRFTGLNKTHAETVQRIKSVETLLKDKGLKLVDAKDGLALAGDDDFAGAKAEDIASGIFDALSSKEQALHMEKPEEFARIIAQKAIAQVLPEAARREAAGRTIEVSDVRKQALALELGSERDSTGKPTHPDFDVLQPFIEDLVANDGLPEKFAKWMNSDPENYRAGLSMLYSKVAHKIAPMLAEQADRRARAEAKKSAAKAAPVLADKGNISSVHTPGKTAEDRMADDILKAKPIW